MMYVQYSSIFYVYSLFCPFSDWKGPGVKCYNIVNFKNSAIFVSAFLRCDTSGNAIKAI